ncbi:MAG: hypothetical protein IKB98_04040 [Clostridia bacterium]|nr:hypothetical protein [Clostridia bacterium]
MKKKQVISPYVKKTIDDYIIPQAIDKIFNILILYQEKGRSTYDTFEEYLECLLKEHYGLERYEMIRKKLVKSFNKS